jgi:hypothetical protein
MCVDFCDSGAIMISGEDLKNSLVKEIRREEWRNKINPEEYNRKSELFEQIRQENLTKVATRNKNFHSRKYKKSIPQKREPQDFKNVDPKTREAYEKWRKENDLEKKCPQVHTKNLLFLLHYLNAGPSRTEDELRECLKRQNSQFEVFWDSPSYILSLLRRCVLTRDWSNMTYFLLILLNYDRKYLPIVKNVSIFLTSERRSQLTNYFQMCRVMVKFNPLVKECDLEDQFKALIEKPSEV